MGETFDRLEKKWHAYQSTALSFDFVHDGYFMTWHNQSLWEAAIAARDRVNLACGMVSSAHQLANIFARGVKIDQLARQEFTAKQSYDGGFDWRSAACAAIGLGAYAHVIAHCDGIVLHPIASKPIYRPLPLAALLTIAPYNEQSIYAAASTSLLYAGLIFSWAHARHENTTKEHRVVINDVITSELLRGWL